MHTRRQIRDNLRQKRESVATLPTEGTKEERPAITQQPATILSKNIDVSSPFGMSTFGKGWMAPPLQLSETDDDYRYTLDIQGMDKADLKLSLQDNIMIVQGDITSFTRNTIV